MSKIRITVISDTHNKHKTLNDILPGGDLLIHAGDLSSRGYSHEVQNFCKWFDSISNYDHKIFIAGNHDFLFENHPDEAAQIVNSYKWITYLQDSFVSIGEDPDALVKVYGSPWQPEFYNWAFNLPRKGEELAKVWNDVPDDVDILITHGPSHGTLDQVKGWSDQLGCELLAARLAVIKPKIHVCGHIHSGYGYVFDGSTHYFNASVLNERYEYEYAPKTFDWDPKTNSITFVEK